MVELIRVPETANGEAVRHKLAQMKAEKVAFELPDGWVELGNTARLRLLQRQAQIQGSEIALITRDEATHRAANQVGIPVFSRPEKAVNGRWHMSPLLPLVDPAQPDAGLPEPPPWRRSDVVNRQARPNLYQARQRRIKAEERYRRPTPLWLRSLSTVVMGGMILFLLIGFAFYVLPASTVTLTPGRQHIVVDVPLSASADLDVPVIEDRLLTARLIETNIEERGSISTSGSQQKPTDKATGSVVFSNLGNTSVRIPEGTVINTSTSPPITFRTVQERELPGGVGSRIDIPIEALEPGFQGNVRANTINTVSGALRFRARVSNPGGTFGGGSQLVQVVTQSDKDALLAQLKEQVEAKAYALLAEELEAGEWLPPEGVQSYVIAQAFDQFDDDVAEQLDLTLRVLVQGVAVPDAEVDEALMLALQEEVPERGRLVANTVTIERRPQAATLGRSVQFTMTAEADYVIPIDPVEVRQQIIGLTPEEASQSLTANWQLDRTPEIYQDPDWLGTLPRFPNRIQVRVEYQEPVALE